MRIIIIGFLVLIYIQNGFSQVKNEKTKVVIDHRFGFDLGFGNNSFSGKYDDYSKLAIDLGMIYKLNQKLFFGFDLSFSPLGSYENTGVNGSRSTHFKWDCGATCIEPYIGHRLFDGISLFAGIGSCFSTEYDVKKGYKNLTAYKRNQMTYSSPIIGVTFEIPNVNFIDWYLKYDMAIGEYDRVSFSAGVKF